MRSLYTINHLLPTQNTSRTPCYSHPKNPPPIFARVAERSERRYDKTVREGWSPGQLGWYEQHQEVKRLGVEVMGNRCLKYAIMVQVQVASFLGVTVISAARSLSLFYLLLNCQKPSHPSVSVRTRASNVQRFGYHILETCTDLARIWIRLVCSRISRTCELTGICFKSQLNRHTFAHLCNRDAPWFTESP
jgi:hypothetical protein